MIEDQHENSADLESRFVDVMSRLDLPETDMVADVLGRINDGNEAQPTEPVGRCLPRLTLTAAAAAAVLAVGLAAFTPVGPAVADWFGIGATGFEVDGGTDRTDGTDSGEGGTNDFAAAPGAPLPDFAPIESLGRPDNVVDHPQRGRTYIWDDGAGNQVHLSARIADGSILSVKSLAAAEDVEFVTISPAHQSPSEDQLPGVWIGAPHELRFPVDGLDLELTVDSGPVLIWVDDDVELRLEGAPGKAEALTWAAETVEGTRLAAAE